MKLIKTKKEKAVVSNVKVINAQFLHVALQIILENALLLVF